jgi:tripartite-type tricarboxylate transporter receptor subunit TctC
MLVGPVVLPTISRLAFAETFPAHPIRIMVPFAAGGGVDFVARIIGEHVSRTIGQPVIVENKVGAGGMLGIETVAKSSPDGYTILFCNDSIASAPQTARFNVDYIRGLLPVIQTVMTAQVIVVHPSSGIDSIADLIEAAKRRPSLAYATSGTGTQQHFLMEWIAKVAGIKLEHIPYRGMGQAVNDLIAGHVLIAAAGPGSIIAHHKAGTLRIIAQSSRTRSQVLPEVPTLEEAGLQGVVLETWQGTFAPAGTSHAVISRLNAEIHDALLDSTIREKLSEATYEPVGGGTNQFARVVRDEASKYERLARELNIGREQLSH